ncbi:MAG TPA: secretin N-terminal domain-containing protein [Chthoniobacterales bacterium]
MLFKLTGSAPEKSISPKGNEVDRASPTYYIKPVLRLFCIAALFLAAINSGFGQTKAAAPPTLPNNPQAAPVSEEPVPPPPPPATTPIAQDRMVTLQYPNSDVADVLHLYEQLTGKKLVMDNFVQGKVNIFLAKPLPREDAIKIIEMNLLMNGYSLVPAEGDVVKVIGTGRNPRGAGVPIISDDADIPSGDHVISFLFKLRYADPLELQQVLGQYLSPPQTFTSFLALPKSSSILVTENSSVIRALVHIIDQVDIPPAEVVSEFIKLERADATKVVEMLKEVFDKGNQPTTPGVPGIPGVKGVRPIAPIVSAQQSKEELDIGALAALSEDSIVVGKIKIAADVRTNRIHIITRPVNMRFIRKLIAEFDANVEFGKPVTRPLRYISAAEILPVLVQALTEPGTSGQAGPEGANPNANPQQQQPRPRSTSTGNTSGFDSGSSNNSSQGFSEELSTTAVDTTPKAVTIGNAKIIADQRANAIIVLGNREVVVKVGKILDEMDVKAPQVALSTVIGELTLNNEEDFGVDWFQKFKHTPDGTRGQTGIASITSNGIGIKPIDAATLTSLANLAAGVATNGGTSLFLNTGFGLSSIVHALDSTGKFRVISRPMVFTTNNKKAIIASGTEIPVPVSTLSSFQPVVSGTPVNNFGTQSSIQFKKVALQLEVVPLINSEKEVTLDILQKLDSVADSTNIDGNLIPNIATRYIKTTVSAANGSTIVLGGLITDNKRTSKTGIPLLSRIPMIGAIFRNTTTIKNRTELIVLMRPEVALTKLDAYRLRQKSDDRTHFGPELDQDDCPDCPRPGDGKQHDLPAPDLPGMK